jgi:hypothetical protein
MLQVMDKSQKQYDMVGQGELTPMLVPGKNAGIAVEGALHIFIYFWTSNLVSKIGASFYLPISHKVPTWV